MRYPCLVLLILASFLSACAVNPATGQRDFVLMSELDELALGRDYSQQVMKQYRVYDNPALQQYIQSVGERVARVSHRNTLVYRFTLLDSTEVNAFALPGGYIYITRGLLAYLNSEAELAAVLGHELGHITARHSVRQHSMSTTATVLGSLVSAASGIQQLGQVSHLLATGIVRGYGREHELEADGLAVGYLLKAGYPASAMRAVISTLKNQQLFDQQLAVEQGHKPRAYHGLFSTHPDNDTRLQQVLNQAGSKRSQTMIRPRQDKAFLRRLEGLSFADSEQDGVIKGRNFYHSDLKFKLSFPNAWLIHNKPNAIKATPSEQGAFIQLSMESLNKALTPRQLIRQRLAQTPILSEMSISDGDYLGHTVVFKGRTPYGQTKVRVAVIYDQTRAFVFYATAKKLTDFKHFDVLFLKTIRSLSKLKRADRARAKPLVLGLVRAESGRKQFARLVESSPIADHAEENLRLLNDIFPTGKLKSGDLIKIVR